MYTISIEYSVLYYNGLPVKLSMYLKFVFTLTNSADPDEVPHKAAFNLGLHCLLKYRFINIKNEKD